MELCGRDCDGTPCLLIEEEEEDDEQEGEGDEEDEGSSAGERLEVGGFPSVAGLGKNEVEK